jgi:hypothetical protein
MRTEADLQRHLGGKKHALRVAHLGRNNNQTGEATPTHSRDFFSNSGPGKLDAGSVRVITCDLENPFNAGKMCRLVGNFCPHLNEGKIQMLHVYSACEIQPTQFIASGKLKQGARGCQKHIQQDFLPVEEFVHMLKTDDNRPPLTVVETAAGAISLHDWELQRADRPAFNILLGGETKGVPTRPSWPRCAKATMKWCIYRCPGFACPWTWRLHFALCSTRSGGKRR